MWKVCAYSDENLQTFSVANLSKMGSVKLCHFDLPYTVHACDPCWLLPVSTGVHDRVSVFSGS